MGRFEELELMKHSARFYADLYKKFSSLKHFWFRNQITRSTDSGLSNFAEGYERSSTRETVNIMPWCFPLGA